MKANRPYTFKSQLQFDEFCRCIRNLKVGDVIHLTKHHRSFRVIEVKGQDPMYKVPQFRVDELPSSPHHYDGLNNYSWSVQDCSPIDRIVKAVR